MGPGGDGGVRAQVFNAAISKDLLEEILVWKEDGNCTMDDIVLRLRLRTVPTDYQDGIHTWYKGEGACCYSLHYTIKGEQALLIYIS